MAMKKHGGSAPSSAGDASTVGRFVALQDAWRRIVDLGNDARPYRFFNVGSGGATIRVLVETAGQEPRRLIDVPGGSSADIVGSRFSVRVGPGTSAESVEGRYCLVS